MSKKQGGERAARKVAASVLTQQDANAYRTAVKRYGADATTSKAKAQKKLQSLGFYTAKGRLAARYG